MVHPGGGVTGGSHMLGRQTALFSNFITLLASLTVGCGGNLRLVNQVELPLFDPPGGYYDRVQQVTLSSETSGAEFRYTVDGSEPSRVYGRTYRGPFLVPDKTLVRAIACLPPFLDSEIAEVVYDIDIPRVEPPVFHPAPGQYIDQVVITMTSATPWARISYTTDGSEPSLSHGDLYTGPIKIKSGKTGVVEHLKAIAYVSDMKNSTVTSGFYTVTPTQVSPPVFDPPPGDYVEIVQISISTTTPDAIIRYTLDGSEPSEKSGIIYTVPLWFESGILGNSYKIKAVAYHSNFKDSEVSVGNYTLTPPGRCGGSHKFKCVAGKGELSDYIPSFQNHFNNQARQATAEQLTWCTNNRIWHQDWLGSGDDSDWLCDPDSNEPYAFWQDEQGNLVREAWLHICSFENIAIVNGWNLIAAARSQGWVLTSNAICDALLAANTRSPQDGGGQSYWEVHEISTNTTYVDWLKRRNNP